MCRHAREQFHRHLRLDGVRDDLRVRRDANEPALGERTRGPAIGSCGSKPLVRPRMMLMVWPCQRYKLVDVEKGCAHDQGSSSACRTSSERMMLAVAGTLKRGRPLRCPLGLAGASATGSFTCASRTRPRGKMAR